MYIAGWNMPGYLPDNEPAHFDTFEEAKQYIIDELMAYADEEDADEPTTLGNEIDNVAQDVNLESRPFTVYAGKFAWWVEPCDPAGCTTNEE